MLAAVAAVPAAPILVPEVCPSPPAAVRPFATAVRTVVDALPEADVAVLVAGGGRGVYDRAVVDLAGLGTPHVTAAWKVHAGGLATLARAVQLPQRRSTPLPLPLACLSLHLDGRWPLVPVTVPADASWEVLVATGSGIVGAFAQAGLRAVLIVAADGSAGLSPRAPRAEIPGAAAWQEELVGAVRDGALQRLEHLGPDAAERVAALGWAPLAVLHGATARSRVRLILRA